MLLRTPLIGIVHGYPFYSTNPWGDIYADTERNTLGRMVLVLDPVRLPRNRTSFLPDDIFSIYCVQFFKYVNNSMFVNVHCKYIYMSFDVNVQVLKSYYSWRTGISLVVCIMNSIVLSFPDKHRWFFKKISSSLILIFPKRERIPSLFLIIYVNGIVFCEGYFWPIKISKH